MGHRHRESINTGSGRPARNRPFRLIPFVGLIVSVLASGSLAWATCAVAGPLSTASPAVSPALSSMLPPLAGTAQAASIIGRGRPRERSVLDAKVTDSSGTGGEIAGVVTSATTGGPIAAVEACAFPIAESLPERCEITDASGAYAIPELPAGKYGVEFFVPPESGINYLKQYYNGQTSESEAESVVVTAGGVTSGINAVLQPGGSVTGTVTDATGKPIAGIRVCAPLALAGTESLPNCGATEAAGNYDVVGLPTGEYKLSFMTPPESKLNYLTQYYKEKTARSEADPVSVTAGVETSAIDAVLLAGGEIAGTVTSFAGGASLEGIKVCASATSGEPVERCASSDASGNYEITSLSTGNYKVGFSSSGEYETQYYKEELSLSTAQEVAVEAGGVTRGIDAALSLKEEFSHKPPQNIMPPRVSGTTVEGDTLKVAQGTWTGEPQGFTDEWGRCDGAGENCTNLGSGESYTLSEADVGHTIRIRETAWNKSGEGQAVDSPPSQLVAGASPTPAASTAVPGATEGLLQAPFAGTLVQIRALLVDVLTPKGRNAKIGALLKHGNYTLSVRAPSAGQLVVSWYLIPKKGPDPARPIVAALGRVRLTQTGLTKLTIRLTTQGRSILRHARVIRLTAKGVLTPTGREAVRLMKAFTLKR